MNMKRTLTATLAATLLAGGVASAEMLRGEVYQVADGDVYVEMADHTVVRVPVETANFYLRGNRIDWNDLQLGNDVLVDYEPVYGFQHYYFESAEVEPVEVKTYLIDVDPSSAPDYVEYDGRLYRVLEY